MRWRLQAVPRFRERPAAGCLSLRRAPGRVPHMLLRVAPPHRRRSLNRERRWWVVGCQECHPPPLYVDHLSHDVGTASADEKIGPAYDTPTLRGLYASAPYFHDGSAATLYEALTRPSPGSEHDVQGVLTGAEIQDLIAFLMALPYGE